LTPKGTGEDKSLIDSYKSGFTGFYTNQYDYYKGKIEKAYTDPIGAAKENFLEAIIPITYKMQMALVDDIKSNAEIVLSGDLNAIAQHAGNGTGEMSETAALALISGGVLKFIGKGTNISNTGLSDVKNISNGADNIASGAKLKTYYQQAEKYGAGSTKELSDGRFRFYGEIKAPIKEGEMAGARFVREWNPANGVKRNWYETVDYAGNIRQVRPDPSITGGVKTHYMFDSNGNFTGSWVPKR